METLKTRSTQLYRNIQNEICTALEKFEPEQRFLIDNWDREDLTGESGGGGETRILRNGIVFEQAGVNFSEVHGLLPPEMSFKLTGYKEEQPFYATGVSLVIHPHSPRIPTSHANFRYLEVGDYSWFGGGADLTPYSLNMEDATHFHSVLKKACDTVSSEFYPKFKKDCDEYFFIKHRRESRGVGGIFFDYLGKYEKDKLENYFEFSKVGGNSFIESYVPIVNNRREENWSEREKEFQLLRRGRYVEFNLVYDRGTHFGLHTNGRAESILMSIPPIAKWQYENDLAITDDEKKLQEILRSPLDWAI